MNLFRKIQQNLFSIFQTGLVALLVVMIVVFFIVMGSKEPLWIFELLGLAEMEEPKHEALKFVGIGMGGVLVALQALMSYKRAKAMEETANAQARAVLKTGEGQRQERIKNAIEHLGHESDSVRLGGAYELFHLAEDTEALRQTVLDILCAHIRRTTSEVAYREKHRSKPSEEVQSLLTLLFVQNHCVFKGCQINLQESWLNGAHLCEARLSMANLVYAHLKEASLSDAHLQGSDLLDADLAGACLFRADLQGANLNGASLQASRLSHAKLQGSVIENTCLHGAVLSSAFLQGASFAFCGLQGANLAGASLQGAGMKDWNKLIPFAVRIRKSIGQIADLSTNVFSNGLTQEEVDSLVEGLSESKARHLSMSLMSHIGESPISELPEGSGANTKSYTKERAEEWIIEYHKSVSVQFKDKC